MSPVQIYTLDEVAEVFHTTRQQMKKVVRDHPQFFRKAGRTILIEEKSLRPLWDAMTGFDQEPVRAKVPGGRKPVVYVVGYGPYVKIGMTGNLRDRLEKLQTHAPQNLQLYAALDGGEELECALHERFAFTRLQGEWFFKALALEKWIKEGCPL